MIPAEEQAQRRAALRALLAKPLLVADTDGETLVLVRRHLTELREWLNRETGWRLVADSETARLFKTAPVLSDASHPARGHNKEPFGRRRYVTLCLALSALARADAQTTLGSLADDVLTAAAEPELAATRVHADPGQPGGPVRPGRGGPAAARLGGAEPGRRGRGRVPVGRGRRAVRRAQAGAERAAVRHPRTVHRDRRGPFEERLAELTAEPVAESDELRNQALRRRLTRRLLEDPVVYYDELDEDERAYLLSQRHAITRRIEEATGLIPEMRAEGIAMVDPDDELTDVRMPEQRTDGHVTLLVAEYLARREQATLDELHAFVRQAAAEHAAYWRKGVTEPGAETELLAIALEKLSALRLVRSTDRGPQPAGDRAFRPGRAHHPRDEKGDGRCCQRPVLSGGSRCGPAWSTCSTTTPRSSGSTTAGCCCAATTEPASPRCSR